MKIGLNATCFNDRPSGAKQRFIGMYNELFKLMPDAQFIIFQPEDCSFENWFDEFKHVSFYTTPIPSEGRLNKFFKGFFFWNKILRREKFDLFEGFNLPMFKNRYGKTVMTIHDLRGLKSEYSLLYRKIFKTVLNMSFKNCDHIITGSKIIQKDISSLFPKSSISVIYNGIDAEKYSSTNMKDFSNIQSRLNLPEKFLLAVGHFEKRKNYIRLLNAISKLKGDARDFSLVIIGNNNGELENIIEHIDLLNMKDRVKIYSGLTDLEVYCAYKSCSLFIFPSLYEGFGIPILEAMNAKAPVLLSDIDVFKEITENALSYFNPIKVQSIQDSIQLILSDVNLKDRNINYGQKRIQLFTFKKLASQLEGIYRDLYINHA